MKIYKQNGEIIECSVEEYKELIGINNERKNNIQKATEALKNEIDKEIYTRKDKSWSEEELKLLKNNLYTSIEKRMNLISGRTKRAIQIKTSKLRNQNKRKKPSIVMSNKNDKKPDKRILRMKFINNKAKYYVKQYGWSYEKAKNVAIQDYNNKNFINVMQQKKQENSFPIFKENTFPLLKTIPLSFQEIIQSILKNIVQVKPHSFTIKEINMYLATPMSNEKWNDFCMEVIQHSDRISRYFSVPNKFAVDNGVLVYK